MIRLCRLFVFLTGCLPVVLQGQALISVQTDFSRALIQPAVLRDPMHRLTLDSIRTGAYAERFEQTRTPYFTFGSDPSNWWLHFRVMNTLPAPKTVILRLNRKNFDVFNLYQEGSGGDLLPFEPVGAMAHEDTRYWLTDGYHFAITLMPGENRFWGMATNRIGSMHLGISLHTPDDFALLSRFHVLLFGLFCGVMVVSILFSILLFAQYRNVVYLLYLAYVVNILLREAYGYSADFGAWPVFQRNAVSILIATTYALFFRQFLRLWELNAWVDRVVKVYAMVIALVAFAICGLVKADQGALLKIVFLVVDRTNLFFTIFALAITLRYGRSSLRAKITTIAYLPLAAGFVAILLRNMNVIPNYPIISQAVMLGFIIEVLVFTIGFSYWNRVLESDRKLLQLQLEVEKQENKLAVQAAEQRVKDRIARDLHDDVAASMSGIRILSQVAHGHFAGKIPAAAELLEQISRSAQATLESIGDLIWAVKPSPDYLNDIADRMREYAAKVFEAKDIAYQLNIPRNLPIRQLDIETRRNIYLVFKESVNNALKYSQCTAIEISLQLAGNTLELVVHDNGVGFDRDAVNNGNGLDNMARRARDVGGELSILSAPGQGTRVIFRL